MMNLFVQEVSTVLKNFYRKKSFTTAKDISRIILRNKKSQFFCKFYQVLVRRPLLIIFKFRLKVKSKRNVCYSYFILFIIAWHYGPINYKFPLFFSCYEGAKLIRALKLCKHRRFSRPLS
jgi:hypothetical protein